MTPRTRKIFILAGSAAFLLLLLTIVFVEAAFNLSRYLSPTEPSQTVVLFALNAIIVVSLIVFSLVLTRYLIKLYVERRSAQLGSNFKTKLLAAFLGLPLIPTIFLFIFAYGLINRSLDKWFSMPVDTVLDNARAIVKQYQSGFQDQTYFYSKELALSPTILGAVRSADTGKLRSTVERTAKQFQIEAVGFFDRTGKPILLIHLPSPVLVKHLDQQLNLFAQSLRERSDIVQEGNVAGFPFVAAGTEILDERLHLAASVVVLNFYPSDLQEKVRQINLERSNYAILARDIKTFKTVKVLTLLLITIAILFSASWIAVYLSKRITIPIQALAEATQKVAGGDLNHRVSVEAQDELKLLVQSFNDMTQQLHDKSEVIQQSTAELEAANRELETRRQYIETVVESIPSGVVSLNNEFMVTHLNGAAIRLLNTEASLPCSLKEIFDPSVFDILDQLLRRARVLSISSRELALPVPGERQLYGAITACALRGGDGENLGYLLVIEDLTELLKAQKSAAWREVARRMAHEIKNPLTPIQLSAERILRNLTRLHDTPRPAESAASSEALEDVIEECASTINQEVTALKNLVNEFSRFARLPSADPMPTDLNKIIEQTLSAYDGRLKDVAIETEFRVELPRVKVDPEQFKRVLVNLIDNAVEAMANMPNKHLVFRTRFDKLRETVEMTIADSGHGVRPQDKDKLFLPYFSTRKRGTGLGLAIVNRIVSDHNGIIRVEENPPRGTRFIIELPAMAEEPSALKELNREAS
ncbi:MAG: ATP-binding protein [Acidobacteriia bacterium]|nr:ATP-binding protein [Terriglobia bacterium]